MVVTLERLNGLSKNVVVSIVIKMKETGLLFILAMTLFATAAWAQRVPDIEKMKTVSKLPPEVAQRANALAFDGEKFWIPLYAARGQIVTFDPRTETWDTSQDPKLAAAAVRLFGRTASPGGLTFADGKMWFANAYGDSFGWLDTSDPEKSLKYERTIRADFENGQAYTDLAFDGIYIWASWKAADYNLVDRFKTQLLLKIDPDTGEIASTHQILFGGLSDGAHGLAWDGESLWYGFGNSLRALDRTGKELAKYSVKGVSRIAGIAWDGDALWLIEFTGKLWKLPMAKTSQKALGPRGS